MRFAFLQSSAAEKTQEPLQLADAIDREVPEFHAEAEKLRERTLAQRLAAAATLSRSDVLSLAERFTQRGQPEKRSKQRKRGSGRETNV